MKRTAFFLAAACAAAIPSFPDLAEAATATGTRVLVEEHPRYEPVYNVDVRYEAEPGELNQLTVTRTGQRLVIDDAGAEIEGRGACTNTGPTRVVCSSSGDDLRWTRVALGERDDAARIESDYDTSLMRVSGGPGDDRLEGGMAFEKLFGGPGDDFIDGGPGGDTINGGGGRDELRAGTPASEFTTDFIEDGDTDRSADADTIVGTASQTFVSYETRRRPVVIDLGAGTGGAEGEGDTLTGITLARGGMADDVLLGTSGADFIQGDDGADVLRGRGGDDRLRGESGADRIFGGGGDDISDDDSDNARDVQVCGPGSDLVASSDKRDILRHSCEDGGWMAMRDAAGDDVNRITVLPAIRRGRAVFRSTCREYPRCRGRIRLKARGTGVLLGRGRFRFNRTRSGGRDPAARRDIIARLTRRGRKRMRRGGYVRVVIVSRWDCGGCLNPSRPVRSGFTTRMRR